MGSVTKGPPFRYKAFISYSHAADNRLAPALRDGLHNFTRPWHRLRAMRVFRDETGLSVTHALWPSIESALANSEYFLLLASPDAAASEWVQREAAWWLDHRAADHLLILLTDGALHWDDGAQDFDWARTDALPRRLSKAFAQVPKYIDLRWARSAADLSLRNPDFLMSAASVASTLQNRPLDELVGEDVRQHRRTRHIAAAACLALAGLAVAAIVFGVIARRERDEARRQQQIATRQEQIALEQREIAIHQEQIAGEQRKAAIEQKEFAVEQQRIAVEQRQFAIEQQQIAVEEKRVATEQRDQARRRLVQFHSASGARAADGGDVSTALLWFTEAAKLESQHPREQGFLRTRLNSLAGKHPHLAQVWSATAAVGGVQFTSDGRWVVVYPRDESGAQVWDTETRSALFKPPGEAVVDAAVTPKGFRLLTIEKSGVHLWDPITRERMRSLAHGARVKFASFDGMNGQHVLTLAEDQTARGWDSTTGREIFTLGGVKEIFDAAFTAQAATLLIKSTADELVLWDSYAKRRVIFPERSVGVAALSRDRRYVLTFGGDSAAAVWSSETGKKITSLGNWEWVDYACLSPDSRRAALVSRNGWAIVWDIASDREVRTLWHQGPVLHAVFRPDGKRLATVSTDRQARVWDVESGKSAAAPLWHEDTVNSVAFSPDGKRLVTTTANQIVRLWDFAAAPGITLPHRATVRSATFSPDGKRILTTTDSSAQLWETTSTVGKAKFVLAPGAQIYHASFSPDGAYVLTASEDRLARLWYVNTGKEITALRHPHRVRHAAFSRNGKMLLTASDRQLAVWDMAALPRAPAEPKLTLLHDDAVEYAEFSADGSAILSIDFGRTARLWNVKTGRERTEMRRKEIRLARLSPDGRSMATGGRAVQVWDVATGAAVGRPVQSEYQLTALAFTPDGRRFATAHEGDVRIWETPTGKPVTPPMLHKSRVMHVAFSADGTRLLTASTDHTARVWNAASGQAITEPLEHGETVRHAEFSPDGKLAVTASADNTARLWNVAPDNTAVKEWTRRSQLLSARRIDETGAVVNIDTTQFLKLWNEGNSQSGGR